MTTKTVTFRFKGCPETKVMSEAIETIKSWPWDGPVEVPARLEYFIVAGRPCHFEFGTVRWNREDGDAILAEIDALVAVVCTTPVDVEARRASAQAAAAKRREEKAEREAREAKAKETSDPALVRPSLRFLLSEEALAEARAFSDRIAWLEGSRRRALKFNADRLDEIFPLVARADAALDGAIARVLVEASELPPGEADTPLGMPWKAVASALASGHPERLTPYAVGGKRYPGAIASALEGMAAIRERHAAKLAAEEASRQSNSGPAVDLRARARAAARAERAERERLGIGLTAEPTRDQYISIQSERHRAVRALEKGMSDCPF